MKTINGQNYSKTEFDNYKVRVKLEIYDTENEQYNFDVYTTDTDIDIIRQNLQDMATKKVKELTIVHYATKEQDDLSSKFIEEWLNEA